MSKELPFTVTCPHCTYSWLFRGEKLTNVTCPRCRRNICLKHKQPRGDQLLHEDIEAFAALHDQELKNLIWAAKCELVRRRDLELATGKKKNIHAAKLITRMRDSMSGAIRGE